MWVCAYVCFCEGVFVSVSVFVCVFCLRRLGGIVKENSRPSDGSEFCSISGERPSSPDGSSGRVENKHTHMHTLPQSDCLMKEVPEDHQQGNEEIMKNNENWQQGGKTIGRGRKKREKRFPFH